MSYQWEELALHIPQIMLPAEGTDYSRWAVVACDQYTSEPEYWAKAEELVGNAPSTLRLMLPEYYLGKPEEETRTAQIRETMASYVQDGTLRTMEPGCVLVLRTAEGRTRRGLVISVDLEAYDFHAGSGSMIRATERTIVERIPPRLRIRKGAPLELPHILLLMDDPEHTVLEPLFEIEADTVYDTDLMQGGGHITGRFLPEEKLSGAREAFSKLLDNAKAKYGDAQPMLFAVGDGNHSLATAKTNWEEIKKTLTPEEAADHPARYALCEIENLHDAGIVFEPIHRVVFGNDAVSGADIIEKTVVELARENKDASVAWGDAAFACALTGENVYRIPCIAGGREGAVTITEPVSGLEVGALQSALDKVVAEYGVEIDYIHGADTVRALAADEKNAGFLLPSMDKFRLFKAVDSDGALPRKTFSMGEANEKRYYIEARSLVK